jgi:hypothetical protein
MLLLLCQAAEQTRAIVQAAPPQILVAVPQTAGKSEFVKTIISASVGALFADSTPISAHSRSQAANGIMVPFCWYIFEVSLGK